MSTERLKGFLLLTLLITFVLALLSSALAVDAKETTESTREYSLIFTKADKMNGTTSYYTYDIFVPKNIRLYGYVDRTLDESQYFYTTDTLYVVAINDNYTTELKSLTYDCAYTVKSFENDGTASTSGGNVVDLVTSGIQYVIDSNNVSGTGFAFTNNSLDTDIPYFDSEESLINYLVNDDDTGLLNKPVYDWTIKHDFTKDTYSTSIPVPQLSNISHEGFTVDNIEGYFIEIIVQNNFYGCDFEKGALLDYSIIPDFSWLYASEEFNFTIADVAVNDSVINIFDKYGHDNIATLTKQFQKWSVEYPSVKDLPTYKWLYGIDINYGFRHLYNSNLDDLTQLVGSGQAETVYFVRFCDMSANYSQWAKYTYRNVYDKNGTNLEILGTGTVIGGIVEPTANGSLITKDEFTASVDTSGNMVYQPYTSTNTSYEASLSGFMETLMEFNIVLSVIPQFFSSIFSFMPWWVKALLGLSITAVIVLRFLGR